MIERHIYNELFDIVMKRTLWCILLLVCGATAFAQDKSEDYHVRVIKNDGTIFEGYNETRFSNYLRPYTTTVSISNEFKGKPIKYNGNEVRRVEFTGETQDSLPMIFEAVIPQTKLPNLFNKNPKPYKTPVFLRLIYEGKNIKGYAMPYTDHTMVPGRRIILYTWRYFYLTKKSNIAVAYWDDTDGTIPKMEKVMKFYFREFPALQELVDRKEITPEMFRKKPAMVLPIMDRTFQSSNK